MSAAFCGSREGNGHQNLKGLGNDALSLKLLKVEKYHGAENDFIFLEMSSREYSRSRDILGKFAEGLCSRNTGVGADGLVIWEATEASTFRMSIWNADGSFAATCGNALRCFALLLLRKSFWNGEHPIAVKRFLEEGNESFARLVNCSLQTSSTSTEKTAGSATVDMGTLHRAVALPFRAIQDILAQNIHDMEKPQEKLLEFFDCAWFIELANPHVVLRFKKKTTLNELEKFAQDSGLKIKENLQKSALVNQEVNLGFLCAAKHPSDHGCSKLLVVHERGAGVTRACGSGAVAAAYALLLAKSGIGADAAIGPRIQLGAQLGAGFTQDFQMPGGRLKITLQEEKEEGYHRTRALMEGPCAFLFTAELSDQAGFRLPRSSSS